MKGELRDAGGMGGHDGLFGGAQPTGRLVRVAVERGIGKGTPKQDALTYRDEIGDLKVGERVEVPLGKERTFGLVVGVMGASESLEGVDPERIKAVRGRVAGSLPEDLVELAVWMAGYYVCPLGMVLAAMTPAAVKKETGLREQVLLKRAALAVDEVAEKLKDAPKSVKCAWDAIAALAEESFPADAGWVIAEAGLKNRRALNELLRRGMMEEVRQQVVSGGHASRASEDVLRDTSAPVELNDEQRRACDGIAATFGSFAVHLLHGVTGSGKTEVYLRLIGEVVRQGKTAIVLVPEIALTPQTAGRFSRRFEHVAVLHSGLTAAQRNREWMRVSKGEVSVVVGARSAIFAPIASESRRLGIIVVDEEHDGGYKQDQLPRYHGRDVAIKRAQLLKCPVVLGSATPSLESWANATTAGPMQSQSQAQGQGQASSKPRSTLWSLTKRATNSPMPRVEVVDLIEQRRVRVQMGDKSQRLLGPTLEAAIDGALTAGGQVILLLNRRGFGRFISCTSAACKFVLECDQCTATLVYHKDRDLPLGGLVRCHHCLSEQVLPRLCPTCGSRIHVFGGGTQRAEEEIERAFAAHSIVRGETLLRVDADSTKSAKDWFSALDRFGKGEIRILLGTQMIAKGLDFPNVRLVGILDADTASNLPDFRASERTFQLIAQVGGRAGRGAKSGLVIVQTANPFSRPVALAAKHDYVTFANEELAARRRFALPPSTRMGRIVCRDENAGKALDRAKKVGAALAEYFGPRAVVREAVECPMLRIAGQYRYEVVVTCASAATLQAGFAALRARGMLMSDAKMAVDVDPIAMM